LSACFARAVRATWLLCALAGCNFRIDPLGGSGGGGGGGGSDGSVIIGGGDLGDLGPGGGPSYNIAKAAEMALAKAMSRDLARDNIRVNAVAPGSILVPGNGWDRYRLANPGDFDDYVLHGFPMGRLGTAEEVADVIVFAASPRAHWINGRNLAVDGLEQPYPPRDRRPFPIGVAKG